MTLEREISAHAPVEFSWYQPGKHPVRERGGPPFPVGSMAMPVRCRAPQRSIAPARLL